MESVLFLFEARQRHGACGSLLAMPLTPSSLLFLSASCLVSDLAGNIAVWSLTGDSRSYYLKPSWGGGRTGGRGGSKTGTQVSEPSLFTGTGAGMGTQGGPAVSCSGQQEKVRKRAEFSQPHLQIQPTVVSPHPQYQMTEKSNCKQSTALEVIYNVSCLFLEFSISYFWIVVDLS